jgi:site-specific DNA-cytosine methylase
MRKINYIDLFAGAGGLSEGFIRAGFNPIAHVEMNKDACDTIKTRTAYHWLKKNNKTKIYFDYLKSKIKNSPTLVTHIATNMYYFINHDKNQSRIIIVSATTRAQSFQYDYLFKEGISVA